MTDRAQALRSEADAHYQAGRFAQAAAAYAEALSLAPGDLSLLFNQANALRHDQRYAEAIAAYDAALARAPSFAQARFNRATCLLQLGDFEQGFREYEWRKAAPGFSEDARYRLPRPWRGEDLSGRRLFVYPEFWQGDLIQFARFALLARSRGAQVTLGAPRVMHALLSRLQPAVDLVADDVTPDYDLQAALLTLPALFGARVDSVPYAGGYLAADPERTALWRERIGAGGFKVGIVWQGSERAQARSFPLALAAQRLAAVPGVRLISLQKQAGLDQLAALPPGMVEDLGEAFDPGPDLYVDTAAAIMACDLVISADTSVAHVAGALGRPTWLALPHAADWRWLEGREDTPWYRSVRLFRQARLGDWAGVFDRMAEALEDRPAG